MKYLFILLASLSFNLSANICSPELGSLPILAGGRTKPLMVHAEESLKFLTGSKKEALAKYCKLSQAPNPELKLNIEHVKVKKLLNLSQDTKNISVKEAMENQETLQFEYRAQKQNDVYKKELNKLLQKINLYEDIIAGTNWLLPVSLTNDIRWVPFSEFKSELEKVGRTVNTQTLLDLGPEYQKLKGDTHLLELKYVKAQPFTWAILIVLAAIGALVLSQKMLAANILIALSLIIQIGAMITRVMISGRAPVTNMYETVMFSGLVAFIVSLIIFFFKREKLYLFAGLGYNLLALFMMKFANNMLSPSISPLVPVLRDNFWLSTHVTSVTGSYGALALSWLLANITLLKKRFGAMDKKEFLYRSDLIYTCIKVGVVLLSIGIILGGVWADYSWGRFWGWDPKETWSLIVLMIYMAILHGRKTSWVTPARFVPLTAGAFLSVMMAWFGVNYILASGLHSYGFSQGGAVFLGVFFLTQIVILIVCGIKKN